MDISKLIEKAREAAERRNYNYAIDLYLSARKMSPDDQTALGELRAVENRVAKEKPPGFMDKAKVLGKVGQARAMLMAKKYDQAIESAEEALKIDATSITAQMIVGRASNQAGYHNAATKQFEDLCTTRAGGDKKNHAEALRELAYAYESVGRIPDAMVRWDELRKLVPEDREAVQKIRDLSASQMSKRIEEGTKGSGDNKMDATKGIMKDSAQTQRQERDAQDIRTADDLHMALADAKADILKRPDDARLYGKLGDLYRRSDNYAEAKTAYETAKAKDPANPQWKTIKLDDLEIWNKTKEVNDWARKAKAGDAAAREKYGKRRQELLEYKLQSFLEREKLYPTDGRIKYELGSLYFDLAEVRKDGDLYDQSIMRYQYTFKDPKYRHESGEKMAKGFARKGQYDLALKRIEETLSGHEMKDERWKTLVYAKAEILEQMGDRQTRRDHLEEALKIFLQIYEIDVAFRDVSKRVEALQAKIKAAGGVDAG